MEVGPAGNRTASWKPRRGEPSRHRRLPHEVEIACDDPGRLIGVAAAVRKDFVQLPEAKLVGASALQVKVVGHHLAPVNGCFRYERDPAADPALKDSQIGTYHRGFQNAD